MHTLEYTEKHEKQNQTSCQDKEAFTDSPEPKSNLLNFTNHVFHQRKTKQTNKQKTTGPAK